MAITIDYSDATPRYVINIPRADMLDVTTGATEVRQLNINDLRRDLDGLNDEEVGISFTDTHVHTPPLTISGVTLARVVEILAPYVIEFEDGAYNVNIVGGNSNISDITIKNNVGVNTANSAGLQDPFALQAAAFSSEVSIDVTSTGSGTTFPYGTRAFPVNNLVDALAIASSRGIRTIRILAPMTVGAGADFSGGYLFIGDRAVINVTVESSTDVSGCEFRNMTVTGDLDGGNTLRECSILDLSFFNGFVFQCGIIGTITLGGASTAVILQSFSLVAGSGPGQHSDIDMGGTQAGALVIRDYQGGLQIKNCSNQQAACSIDMSSGRILFAADVTDGTFTVRGLAKLEDSSGIGATVDSTGLFDPSDAAAAAAIDTAKIDDLHAFQVRTMTRVKVGDISTYATDGGRTMAIDSSTGDRTTLGAEPP